MKTGGRLLIGLTVFAGGLFAAAGPTAAADFSGRVAAVVAGDVVEVLRDGHRVKVRLWDVTCPPKGKRHGKEAMALTARETLDRVVSVVDRGTGKGGQRGEIVLPGNRSLAQELVRNGLAWWDREPSGDPYLGVLEEDARAARRGLWADADPDRPAKGAPKKKRSGH